MKKQKPKIDTVRALDNFIQAVKKKYGEKALDFRIEIHMPYIVDGEEYFGPQELSYMGVAKYKEDKINDYPAETVLVLK